ncbi:Fe-S cluster assembly ATPase SufC [Candidatus Woesearchaeota archaeon]|nr:Fe-S cluster assembly ATPase SufC [Candidatus Woesearchaeota archaeon]
MLELRDLTVKIDGHVVLKNVNLNIKQGQVHVIMGPNGAGKSSLALTIMGHPDYKVVSGDILFENESVKQLPAFERARKGLFLAFQTPPEIEGVSLTTMLRHSLKSLNKYPGYKQFMQELDKQAMLVNLSKKLLGKSLNQGFSGGEKKRSELLQLLLLNPKLAILDEIDSGLDVDALKALSNIFRARKQASRSCLIITHYSRILNYVKPDFVHVLINGEIKASGDEHLARKIEEQGFKQFLK